MRGKRYVVLSGDDHRLIAVFRDPNIVNAYCNHIELKAPFYPPLPRPDIYPIDDDIKILVIPLLGTYPIPADDGIIAPYWVPA